MKKTLAAALALASLALADTGADFNSALAAELQKANYNSGCSYSISATLSDIPGNSGFITLGEGYYLVNQWHRYWGLNMESSNEIFGTPEFYSMKVTGNTYTYTSKDKMLPVLWAQNAEGTGSGQRNAGAHVKVTIDCNGTDTTISLSYGISEITDIFILKGTAIYAPSISIENKIKVDDAQIKVNPGGMSLLTQLLLSGLGIVVLGGIALILFRSFHREKRKIGNQLLP